MIQFDDHIFQMGWFNHQQEPLLHVTYHVPYFRVKIRPNIQSILNQTDTTKTRQCQNRTPASYEIY